MSTEILFGYKRGLDIFGISSPQPRMEPHLITPLGQGVPAESYPHLDYSAPELALLGTVTPAADIFSLGMLIYW